MKNEKKINCIIDTDPGVDDAVAIILSLYDKVMDIKLITTVSGNLELSKVTRNALHILEKFNRTDIPLAIGAVKPMVRESKDAKFIHQNEGLGGYIPPESVKTKPIDKSAVEAMYETICKYKNDIVIGTIKTLEEKYGIEYLIKAFAIVKNKYKNLPLKLLIVGDGSLSENLKKLVHDLNIEDETVFTGKIAHELVPVYDNMLSVSVSVSVSNSESFGVAIIEASACGKPVVVSDVGGLPEVVENGVTGIVVPPRDPEKTADAIEKLVLDEKLRKKMGEAGRKRVAKLYDWNKNVEQMIEIYKGLIK